MNAMVVAEIVMRMRLRLSGSLKAVSSSNGGHSRMNQRGNAELASLMLFLGNGASNNALSMNPA